MAKLLDDEFRRVRGRCERLLSNISFGRCPSSLRRAVFGAAIATLAASLVGCGKTPVQPPPPVSTGGGESSSTSSPKFAGFRERAAEAGIRFTMGFLPGEQGETFKINLYDHGCGIVVGDYDGDGRDDLYFLNQLGPNALYRNLGDGRFADVTAETGVALDDRISVGGTFADYDNDGDQDLYVTSTRGGNVLFRNDGQPSDETASDETASDDKASDGKADRKRTIFVDATEEAGLRHVGHSQTAVFFDYDRDARLDLLVVQTSEWTLPDFDETSRYFLGKGGGGGIEGVIGAPREKNRLYHNEGGGKFVDVTERSGLAGRGWAGDVAVFDYDEDGWLDVFVACMFGRAQLYRNQRDGTFQDVTLATLGRTPFGGIGARAFDANNDGRLDLYVVDMHSDMWMGLDLTQSSLELATRSEKIRYDYFFGPKVDGSPEVRRDEEELEQVLDFRHSEVVFGNAFYKSLGGGRFVEQAGTSNLETFWPWGIATGDFDNDGFEDVFVPSGMGYPFYYWHNYLLMNQGNETFADRSFELGIEPPPGGNFTGKLIAGKPYARSSRCAATADFDGDGRLEIVTNNFNHEPYLFRNELSAGNYLALKLRGTRSNRDAIGALVRVSLGEAAPADQRIVVRQLNPAGGYLSQSSKTLHFGLGKASAAERIEILWPSGQKQVLTNVAGNRLMELVEPDTTSEAGADSPKNANSDATPPAEPDATSKSAPQTND